MVFDDAGASSLEQFTLLAKNARGRACVALIQQALSNKKLFVFRELLDMPNVQALKGTEHDSYFQLLEIFCFGKYRDYLAEKDVLPALNPAHIQKLRKLTTLSLAQKSKIVPYETLMKELDVTTIRELEDILIDTIYSGLVQGKLDQKSKSLIVKYAVGRDTQNADVDLMIEKLTNWQIEATTICERINSILSHADKLAESEKSREENIRAKNVRTAAERAPGSREGNYRGGNDDYLSDFMQGPRRTPSAKRMPGAPGMNRKGRI
ncbi:hypothetical protein Poli38472_000584 [Pythium oligandrum]|uniref:PCI domain-containing protein n=1 Tax=Pythium oligandrum TaxID=41045 RepID=A0A8K1FI89_PYTOL|nr:hypothetical protein Poli38472_000584 [Pythium oligandrum]|eukprot:TMW60542.1 hypothetical protein Poli38472_000584 [Pythium oligandrum]